MALEEFAHYFGESKIPTKERNKLDDSQFGIPSLRKYPLTDEEHVLQALRFFNKAPVEHKKELALNIQKRGKELKMEWWKWFYSGATLADYKDDLSEKDQHIVNGYYTRDKQHEKMPEKKEKLKKKMNDKKKDKKYFGESDEPMKNLSATEEANKCLISLKDVKYDNSSPQNWILRTPDEVIIEKLGNCHDTALYIYNKLDEFAGHPVEKGVLFFIEYNSKNMEGNQTHSVCYEKIDGGICIIEHSWEEWKGTFPYTSINEYIQVARNNWKFSTGCDALFVTEMKNYDKIKPGMNLKQYVDVAMKNEEIISESYTPTGDNTSGTSDFDEDGDSDPDDCFTESGVSNGLINAKLIAARIHEKYESDKQPPTGNQNCQVCVWCAEAQFRGRTDMPRPVYSPRDPVLNISGESIVIHPRVFSMKSGFDDVLDILADHPYARFYCHAKWKEGHGGHEFIIITEGEYKCYIMDPQQGTVDKFLETHPYIKDLKWEDSYLARMDDAEFNETVLRDFNTDESIVPWDAKLDIPYMLEHGMLSEEEAEQYWKEHPDEAPNDRHFLSYEELDRMSESKNIFTSGDFDKYGKDVDLTDARGPIQESVMMEFDHNSEKIPVKNINFDKVYFGSPKKYSRGIRTDRPLFVTPFMGIASIFIYGDLDIQNKVPRGSYNLQYEEWNTASDKDRGKPFKEVHVYVEGYPELEPYEIENTGYIHTVNASKYKNDFYRYEWMADKLEYLIDTDDSFVDVTSVQEVTVHYYVSGKATNNPKLGPYKKNGQAVQESAWQDIKNGVNPFSKNLVFHISKNGALDGQIFKPRVPEYITKYDSTDPKFEDNTTGRICFSPSIEGCLNAILVNIGRWKTADKLGDWYVYIPEKPLNEYKHSSNRDIIKGKKVYDANLTKEIWIEEPVRLKQYGVIHVDQVKASNRKKTVATSDNVKGDRRYYTFKWHWLVKPKVLKDIPYDYSKHETCENLEEELWRFGYGLIKDGKLMKGNISEKDWYKYWRLADPEDFEQAKGGNCYDYVEWESGYLDAFGHDCNKIFIKSSTGNNHAFIYVKDDSKYIFIDGAFNKIDKKTHIMKEFDSLDKCFKYITDAIKKYEKNDSISFTFYDYTKENMKPGTPMKEFEEWIISHGKMVNINKPIKEEYIMSDFERDPSVLQMILEAEAEENDSNDDEKGDAIESTEISIEGEAEIGSDVGGVQNEYNPEEVERINKLINSEMSAVSEYFNAAKESKEPNLMRLYSDIGDEERFHLEQLLYAKSMVTGEEYEPQDPKVKKEYKELLDMGLDEETAMTTAIDKVGLMPKEEEMSDEEEEDLKESFNMISILSGQTQAMLESMDTSNITDEMYNNSMQFLEQMYISEEVYNLNTKEGQKALGTKSPIRMIWNAFKAVYNFVISIVRKAKLAFQKIRIKNREKWAWLKRHGIKGIFQSGISLYFWNDRTGKYEIGDGIRYLQMVHLMNERVIKAASLNVNTSNYNIDKYVDSIVNACKGSKVAIEVKPVSVPSIQKGMNDLNSATLTKSKLIITDENEAMLEELFFGYTDQGYQIMEKEGDNSKNIKMSFNVYNQLNYLLSAFESVSNETKDIIEALAGMEGKPNTVYATNNKAYNECVAAMNITQRALNMFTKAVSSDIQTCLNVNTGLKEAMQKSDSEGNSQAAKEFNQNKQNAQTAGEEAKQNTKNENTPALSPR